jgi:hypothetical protein
MNDRSSQTPSRIVLSTFLVVVSALALLPVREAIAADDAAASNAVPSNAVAAQAPGGQEPVGNGPAGGPPAAAALTGNKTEAARAAQFTFAWPLDAEARKPRGATTRGAPVKLVTEPSADWQRLRAAVADGATDFERDRLAILAMAGPYRVTFDFLEVVRYDAALGPDAPYQSWGTEYVFVAEDRGDFIALQHVLVMRIRKDDGSDSEPMVVRHWRQEWRFQADARLTFDGRNTWTLRDVPVAQRLGAWVQTVYQVDDSPRYAARGRWQHTESFSTWISDETSRPLPRREFSVRNDYDMLLGTNRHTILSTGWVQEENNLKLVLDDGRVRGRMPFLAREYGVARYERIRDFDFEPGARYVARTEPFWAEVRDAWRERIERTRRLTLKAPPDQGQLFLPFFDYAEKLADGATFDRAEARAFVERTLDERYLIAGDEQGQTRSRATY